MCGFSYIARNAAIFLAISLFFTPTRTNAASAPVEPAKDMDISKIEVLNDKTLYHLGWGDDLCAITFDDGPGKETPRLLNLLKEKEVPATFFVVGKMIKYFPNIIRQIHEEGHEIANHTFSHITLRKLDADSQRQEIEKTQKALRDLGINSRFLRPPYGRYDATTVRVATELGVEVLLWAIDSMDWAHPLQVGSLKPQVDGQKLRGIFLFHDIHSKTIDGLPAVIDFLKSDGCHFVTVSEFVDSVHACPITPKKVKETPLPSTPEPVDQNLSLSHLSLGKPGSLKKP